MKKRETEIWRSELSGLAKGLRFSSLDLKSRECMNHEIFYLNNSRFQFIAWAVMALEMVNMLHVLCFSRSGLGTPNNRQYFAMYLLLFLSGPLCLAMRRLFWRKPVILGRWYFGFAAFWTLWHAVLSSMDLRRNPNIAVFTSGIFGLVLLVRLKPWEALCILPGSLLVLLACAGNYMSGGIAINAGIIVLVAVFVSCSRYLSTLEELGCRQKLVLQAGRRTREKQRLEQLAGQQKALLRHSGEWLFIWEKNNQDALLLAGGGTLCGADRETLLLWLAGCGKKREGAVKLYGSGGRAAGVAAGRPDVTPREYWIECTPQFDGDKLIGAAGKIAEKKDENKTELKIESQERSFRDWQERKS